VRKIAASMRSKEPPFATISRTKLVNRMLRR
jgi:hypothetical protein